MHIEVFTPLHRICVRYHGSVLTDLSKVYAQVRRWVCVCVCRLPLRRAGGHRRRRQLEIAFKRGARSVARRIYIYNMYMHRDGSQVRRVGNTVVVKAHVLEILKA